MGKIYYMMGKSASGKDTLFKKVREALPFLETLTLYTTRPIREGERNGVEYFFVTDEELDAYARQGKVVEQRLYHTACGPWRYATVDDGQIDLAASDYLVIGTLESYEKMRDFYGADCLIPLYIQVEDGERLSRALLRERAQEEPKYEEMCRRFLADTRDFSEENIRRAGIRKRFCNQNQEKCLEEIIGEIQHGKF
ncbi:guanylate kinase [uncultured Merdimonas sp.]|uniref:guanylate kinase n=1 Tax=uncultured Merdimonas sp. TaxID=2023269 RepID=UPI003209F13C